ncbi:MAG TPA: DNA-binding response regulator [Balneola sp.]|jgi:DNA-binding NarL/FixJ family response regulator|nr:DNA-binding response regulator [Balneola sp.]MAO77688.1 DNA-binding response regulator [Balneola sp.]MBF63974.1 DNA-binding response regulator [Balneola sp.]HAH52418.1 DNA-binding response regulator [Balneola sp.]HBZ37100.1 DNA-binding response regulator [Balneola sp.]|tara:strand:- start:8428 stop:9057 length:630 start_codon:yes stop_codon:yes gene_type:complete
MIKISIIEDNKYMREGWETILDFESDLCVIGTYGSCEEALEENQLGKSDVLLLDIELPGIHGTEGVKIFKEKYPKLITLMVTMHDENEKIFTALRNGAVGYLLKKTSPQELIEAIKVAVDGGSPMSPNIARKVISSFQKKRDLDVNLSDMEQDILKELASGLSYKAIAEKIFLSVDGVRYHIRNIYQKLEAKNRAEAVAKGISYNLIKS